MQGLNRETGETIDGIEWLEQQINDILTTPKVTRTMRADYGSNLYQFVDRNIDETLSIEIIAEVNSALSVLKDVFKLTKVNVIAEGEKLGLEAIGKWLETGKEITLNTVFIY